tara:strand:+ start:363 stop:1064 length:702 start_codon:yes stop_codon:yes gene_type:complete
MTITELNKEPSYWVRYSPDNYDKLRYKFSGAKNLKENWSQAMQDMFVLSMHDGKKNGFYVEIGADLPRIINNSYLLETEYGWNGVSFEYDKDKVNFFNTIRNNKCVCTDATTFDYKSYFEENNYPKQIDYLQLDIDPPSGTFAALKQLPLDDYRFSVITYETDLYSAGADIQDEEIKIFESYGYELVVRNVCNEGNPFEDWWVDPNIIDPNIIKKFKQNGRRYKEYPECIFEG